MYLLELVAVHRYCQSRLAGLVPLLMLMHLLCVVQQCIRSYFFRHENFLGLWTIASSSAVGDEQINVSHWVAYVHVFITLWCRPWFCVVRILSAKTDPWQWNKNFFSRDDSMIMDANSLNWNDYARRHCVLVARFDNHYFTTARCKQCNSLMGSMFCGASSSVFFIFLPVSYCGM